VIPLPPSSTYKTSAILYDLIPLQFSDQLLISRKQETTYRWLLSNIEKFDYLFSISNTTKAIWEDLVSHSSTIKVIYGAGYGQEEKESIGFAQRFGILCVGAEQQHKNLERLISAYSMLPKSMQLAHPLTIVGIRSSGARKTLAKFSRRFSCGVFLPDYLTDSAIRVEYRSNRILVMPSLSEGLSLPILEAWANGLPAIGSAGTVADELIQKKSLLFDPKDAYSIAQAIEGLLLSQDEWDAAILGARTNAKNYSWAKAADLMLKSIEELSEHD
jgi:glycosyltransferase involved in cell wall biosynthesis